jgi:hypothetical protein
MLLPTAADSGPVQLQIIPTTIGLPFKVVVLAFALVAALAPAAGLELLELLEPHAVKPSAPSVTTNAGWSQRVRYLPSSNVPLL